MTRSEKVAQARVLREQGLTLKEVALRLGTSQTTALRWTNPEQAERDRVRSRALKERYRGACKDCGAPTNGSEGPGKASKRCANCAAIHQHESREWTPETIIAAIQDFARKRGRPPTATEWLKKPGDHPPVSTVQREFGRWATAIRAAGLETYRNLPDRAESAERTKQIAAMYESGLGSTTIARELGIPDGSVLWHLNKAGVKRRSLVEARRLRLERQAA